MSDTEQDLMMWTSHPEQDLIAQNTLGVPTLVRVRNVPEGVSVEDMFRAPPVLWPLPLEACTLRPWERYHPKEHPLVTLKRL